VATENGLGNRAHAVRRPLCRWLRPFARSLRDLFARAANLSRRRAKEIAAIGVVISALVGIVTLAVEWTKDAPASSASGPLPTAPAAKATATPAAATPESTSTSGEDQAPAPTTPATPSPHRSNLEVTALGPSVSFPVMSEPTLSVTVYGEGWDPGKTVRCYIDRALIVAVDVDHLGRISEPIDRSDLPAEPGTYHVSCRIERQFHQAEGTLVIPNTSDPSPMPSSSTDASLLSRVGDLVGL